MFNKKNIIIGFVVVLGGFGLYSCGQISGGGGSSTNYTISGKVGSISASDISASSAPSVTHIAAIGADNVKYLADYDPNSGSFSIKINKGMPYAVGFYNQSNGKITLLGYLKQNEVNWHSLPLMSPQTATSETNLGTIEVNPSSVEAIPSISLNDLLTQVNMTRADANLYGQVDGVMTLFTNVDINGNGVFDFQEDKAYMLQIDLGTSISANGSLSSGEVTKMLNQFNETYYPIPSQYQFILHVLENGGANNPAVGTAGTMKFPTTIYGANGIGKTSLTGAVASSTDSRIWRFMANEELTQCELTTPEVVPSGTYTFEVTGKGAYTFANVAGSPISAVGTTEGLIFPVFKITTNEAGYITTIYYKWLIRENGITREATAAEVKTVIVDTALNSNNGNLIEASPVLGIVLGSYPPPSPDPNYKAPKKIDRDGNSVDVSNWNAKWSDLVVFTCNYKLNSNLSLSFMFSK